ncbi:hypothetical protein C1M55_21390 [Rhodococcus qingshengii]|uniref:hypothetical protein n=1 Tax=Rhodococcus TaxID=1827 RepID=UPI0009777485|nr:MULTISPECIES: hypothetical protein [Rhodococcus]AUS33392.1 hypothetical protein C1M55_21390 [Rhodococcus qingshengii]MCC4305801.1 hypothetical protein [Rhodococcus sp. 3-2]OMQ38058.1 hypothetical protein BK799_01290 [Rhodococcus sp. D-1]
MTAPDPGLTDLIAAHTLRVVELNEAVRYPECNGCDWVGGLVKDHAVHLASVVEQHTNGQITEANVRARARVKAAKRRASIRITQIRKEEAARFEAEARAAKAEATIARVEKLQGDLFQQGGNLIAQWGAARLIRAALQEEFIRAALEGEQQ